VACFLADTETLLAKETPSAHAREPRIPTGHGRDIGNLSKFKSLILLALPRGLEPLFSP